MNPPELTSTEVRPRSHRISSASSSVLSCRQAVYAPSFMGLSFSRGGGTDPWCRRPGAEWARRPARASPQRRPWPAAARHERSEREPRGSDFRGPELLLQLLQGGVARLRKKKKK